MSIGGQALHNGDSRLFAEVMLSWEIRSYRQASQHAGPVFLDRGIPDLAGYYLLLGQPVPAHVTAAGQLFRYHQRVFIAPSWPQIYTTDSERHQKASGSREWTRSRPEVVKHYRTKQTEAQERTPVSFWSLNMPFTDSTDDARLRRDPEAGSYGPV